MKPIVIDLFCCAGGAARGYQRAGFHVVGVDVMDRPNYCGDEFYRMDALQFIRNLGHWRFDVVLVHSSPPCQAGSTLTTGTNRANGWGREHQQLVPAMRELLEFTGLPYVIEQPAGHGGLIRRDLTLCMDMFPIEPPRVFRHRDFELGGPWPLISPAPPHPRHTGRVRGMRHGIVHSGDYVAAYGNGGGKATVAEMQHALGIDWTDVREELTEAIPPAYTEWIGRMFLAQTGLDQAMTVSTSNVIGGRSWS